MRFRISQHWLFQKKKYLLAAGLSIAATAATPSALRGSAAIGVALALGLGAAAYYRLRMRVPRTTPLPALRVTSERNRLAAPAGEWRFAVLGDLPLDPATRGALLRAAQADGCRLLCFTGDVVKYSNTQTWKQYIELLGRHLEPDCHCFHTPGNHDIDHNLLGRDYRFYRHYLGRSDIVVEAGDFRLVFLDTANLRIEEGQFAWLGGLLEEAGRDRMRTILILHAPPRRVKRTKAHCLRTDVTERLERTIEGRDVAAVFGGHVHRFYNFEWVGTRVWVGGVAHDATIQPVPSSPDEGVGFYRVLVKGRELTVEPVMLGAAAATITAAGR